MAVASPSAFPAAMFLALELMHRVAAYSPAPLASRRSALAPMLSASLRKTTCSLTQVPPSRIAKRSRSGLDGMRPGVSQCRYVRQNKGRNVFMQAFVGEQMELGPEFVNHAVARWPVQPVDFTTLSAVSAELQAHLPMRVTKVTQRGETDISLTLKALGDAEVDIVQSTSFSAGASACDADNSVGISLFLLLSWHRKFGRMCYSFTEPVRSSKSAFASSVEDTVSGLFLVSVQTLPFSSILRLDFSSAPANLEDVAGKGAAAIAKPAEVRPLDADGAAMGSVAGNDDDDWQTDETDADIHDNAAEDFLDNGGVKVKRARIYLQVGVRGHTRIVLVGHDDRVVTTAPAMDQRGEIWSRIGKYYIEPERLEMDELGEEPSLQLDLESWRSKLLGALGAPSSQRREEGGEYDDEEMKRGGRRKKGGRDGKGGGGVELVRGGKGGESEGSGKGGKAGGARKGKGVRGGNESVKGALMLTFRGLSSSLVEQMISAAGIPRGELLRTMSEEDYARLFRVWTGWLWAVNDGLFRASASGALPGRSQGREKYSVIPWPSPSPSSSSRKNSEWAEEEYEADEEVEGEEAAHDVSDSVLFDSCAECVQWYYAWAELAEMEQAFTERTDRLVQQLLAKKAGFANKALEAEGATLYKAQGEALLRNQQLVAQALKNRATTVTVPDWSNFGDSSSPMASPALLDIEVDSSLSAQENANRYFSRFKKLARQANHVEALLDQTVSHLTELIAIQNALTVVPYGEGADAAMAAMDRMHERLESRGLLKPRPGGLAFENQAQAKGMQVRAEKQVQREMGGAIKVRGRNKKDTPEFMRFKSPSGYDVVAGRSSSENDRVTWGVARDWDLWFHARGIGGSHVVLLAPPTAQVRNEDVEFAAQIAATHSKAKQDTKVDVSYTQRKHLRSPPQRVKKPGMVMITREQTITVKPLKRDKPLDSNLNKGKYA